MVVSVIKQQSIGKSTKSYETPEEVNMVSIFYETNTLSCAYSIKSEFMRKVIFMREHMRGVIRG